MVKATQGLSMLQKKLDLEVKHLPDLNLSAWEEELDNDLDYGFILQGIKRVLIL